LTRSSKGIVGGVLSRDRSLKIRGTSSRRLEFSSSYSIVAPGVGRVERMISGSNG
jgi:hypothetical protein